MESLVSPGVNFAERLTSAIRGPLVVGVIILALVAFAVLMNGTGKLGRLKVRPRPLMTQAERRVCVMIEAALPGAWVQSQVSMGAIMQPDNASRNRIGGRPSTGSARSGWTSWLRIRPAGRSSSPWNSTTQPTSGERMMIATR